jgi:hypothetical protein
MDSADSWTVIQNVAATFGAAVFKSGNNIKLVQERPTNYSRIISNSNVENGAFEYVSTARSSRYTACIVYWNDPAQNMLRVPCYYEDTAASSTEYGLRVKEVTARGITSEGQAMRLARWHVDTSFYNQETVTFKVGFNNAGIEPGEVIKLMDSYYAISEQDAKVVSFTADTVTLDRPLQVEIGNTIDVVSSDGLEVFSRPVTTTGLLSTIGFSGGVITTAPGRDVILSGSIQPRLFKVLETKEDSKGSWIISAAQYDPNKFARVDNTPTGPVPVYQAKSTIPSKPLNLAFVESAVNVNNTIRNNLTISWSRPADGTVASYVLGYRRNSGNWEQLQLSATSYTIDNAMSGTYEAQVFATSVLGIDGPAETALYTIDVAGGGVSPFDPPTNLVEASLGASSFQQLDLNIKWTNPVSNAVALGISVRDFEVRFIETNNNTELRRVYVAPVAAGAVQTTSYTYSMNIADGGPRRSIKVEVRVRDTKNNLSEPAVSTFTNDVPSVPSGIEVAGGIGSTFLKWTNPSDPDFRGTFVWGSAIDGFVPSEENLLSEGDSSFLAHGALDDSSTWFYRIASYDSFSKPRDGAGLNMSGQLSSTTLAGANVNEYRLTGITWKPNDPETNSVSWTSGTAIQTLGGGAGSSVSINAGSAAWTSGVLYIYYVAGNSTLQASTSLSNAVADNKVIVATYRGGSNLEVSDGRAFQDGSLLLAGTVGASQLVTGSAVITQGAQIANAVITDAKIVNLSGTKIDANSITADKIDARGLSIEDPQGNVILAAGTALSAAYAAPGTLNSAVTLNPNGTLSGAGGGQVTLPGMGLQTFRVFSHGYSSSYVPVGAGIHNATTGAIVSAGGPMWGITKMRRSDGAVLFSDTFMVINGVYTGTLTGQNINTVLNGADATSLVIATTYDEPQTNRLAFADAMYRCGASRAVFGSPNFRYRSAYVLIGVGGCGEGQGYEAYAGLTDNSSSAWVDTTFSLLNGNVNVSGATATPRALSDYGYTGDLNATNGATFGVNIGGQITPANVSTYIANAAIKDAQIESLNAAKISATSLSAISATIGLLRTATTGSRMEIADNVIRIYDGNVLRVKIGNLA